MGGAQQCAPLASLTMIDRHYGHLARDGRDTRSSFSTRSTRPNPELSGPSGALMQSPRR